MDKKIIGQAAYLVEKANRKNWNWEDIFWSDDYGDFTKDKDDSYKENLDSAIGKLWEEFYDYGRLAFEEKYKEYYNFNIIYSN